MSYYQNGSGRDGRKDDQDDYSSYAKSRACRQSFPVQGPNGEGKQQSTIVGGGPNRNFPSAVGAGQQITSFRNFSKKNVEDFCCYDPCKDYRRCLRENVNATPSRWTREQAELIRLTPDNTAPVIQVPDPFVRTSPDLWIWDTWPLKTKDGSIAVLPGGWRVIFALTAPQSVLPGKRHDIARIGYFYSRNGLDWIEGGALFPEGASLGSREWAGSAFVEDGRIHFFYTATGRRGETTLTFEQRIAYTTGEVFSDLNGVLFDNWSPHQIILEPDGVLYQTLEQSQGAGGIIYAFRDPYFFKDPATGCEYLLFEGNVAGTPEDIDCGPGVPPEARAFTGNIGIALLHSRDFTEWTLLPALLEATCTNQQTERPHIVVHNGRYFLFTDSHEFTFAPGLTPGPGPDGLYGFVASSLRGNYVPLNESGLVIGNPPQEPFQAYSWFVLPDLSVISFIDNFNLQGIPIQEVGLLPAQFQFAHFGGTLAPTLQLEVTGPTTTSIVNELGFGLVMLSQAESPKCIRTRNEVTGQDCDNRPRKICKKHYRKNDPSHRDNPHDSCDDNNGHQDQCNDNHRYQNDEYNDNYENDGYHDDRDDGYDDNRDGGYDDDQDDGYDKNKDDGATNGRNGNNYRNRNRSNKSCNCENPK
ncbi:MAG: lsc [Anaerocolumna sp.]|jgi:levansucrase|nr:lsc [Anaerocolumna sp.]